MFRQYLFLHRNGEQALSKLKLINSSIEYSNETEIILLTNSYLSLADVNVWNSSLAGDFNYFDSCDIFNSKKRK